ncbi:MAG: nuclear transport factor 2 family protein [Alphaproteobacteria bacterium]|nr:MAG: nuclear transport factor 2 family protein [Alphaproteobacteria bacterium]
MKHMTTIACAAFLAGCAQHTGKGDEITSAQVVPVAGPTLEQFQHRIDQDYIAPFMAGEVDRWLQLFDDDIVGLHNRMPAIEGKPALRGFAEFVSANLVVAEMSVTLTGLRQDGDLAYTWGTYRSRLLMGETGDPMPGHNQNGKVLFVWKRQADGSWKLAVDMGNELPPSSMQ